MFLLYQDPLKGSWNKKSLRFVFIDLSIPAVIQGFLSCLLLDCGVFLIGACLSVIFWHDIQYAFIDIRTNQIHKVNLI